MAKDGYHDARHLALRAHLMMDLDHRLTHEPPHLGTDILSQDAELRGPWSWE